MAAPPASQISFFLWATVAPTDPTIMLAFHSAGKRLRVKKKIEKKGHTFHLWPFPGVPTEHLCQKSSYLATLNLEWKLGTPFAFPVAVYPAKN